MKMTLTSTLVTLALLLAIGFFTSSKGANASRVFIEETEALVRLVESEDWIAADEAVRALGERWEEENPALQTFLIHGDIDEVNLLLTSLEAATKERERFHALWFLAELTENFGHLRHRDSLTLKNIL